MRTLLLFAMTSSLVSASAFAQMSFPDPSEVDAARAPAQVKPPLTKLEAAAIEVGATPDRYVIEYLMLPMRDGVRLQTVVIRPKDGLRHPTIVDRTPYQTNAVPEYAARAFASGYAFVTQNERGSEWSEGDFQILGNTTNDAYDSLTWIADQPWSNGRAALDGCSSSAENQLLLGSKGHPALKAMVPMSVGAGVGNIPGVMSEGMFYKGGVPNIGTFALWYAPFGYVWRPKLDTRHGDAETAAGLRNYVVTEANFANSPSFKAALDQSMLMAPSRDILRRLGVPAQQFDTFISKAPGDDAWRSLDLIRAGDTGATPTLNINGWYDFGAYETVKLFEFQQQHPDQYLIMAPSAHCSMVRTSSEAKVGERPVGDSRFPYVDVKMSWFDHFLKDDAPALMTMPKVQTFLMGADTWLTGDRWPLRETRKKRFYLSSAGKANSAAGDGVLTERLPGASIADHYVYDPENPTPSVGGSIIGVVSADQRKLTQRRDLLVYTSPALEKGLAVVGDVRLNLHLSTDVKDTDVAVKLVDVYPDGTAYNVQSSIQRLRYRNGYTTPEMMKSGQIYTISIGNMTTSNYFAPGHKLQIIIAGSDFPNFEKNMNMGTPNDAEIRSQPASMNIFHGGKTDSYLEVTEYTGKVTAGKSLAGK